MTYTTHRNTVDEREKETEHIREKMRHALVDEQRQRTENVRKMIKKMVSELSDIGIIDGCINDSNAYDTTYWIFLYIECKHVTKSMVRGYQDRFIFTDKVNLRKINHRIKKYIEEIEWAYISEYSPPKPRYIQNPYSRKNDYEGHDGDFIEIAIDIDTDKFLPDAVKDILPDPSENNDEIDPIVYLRYFSPYGGYTFYVTNYERTRNIFWGVGDALVTEHGTVSVDELRASRVERDAYFRPMRLSEVKDKYNLRL